MVVHTVRRKKPKKPDFVHKGVRYWISAADYYLFWDGEYSNDIGHTVSFFDSDEEFDEEELWDDPEYMEKAYKAGCRMMPFNHYAYNAYF